MTYIDKQDFEFILYFEYVAVFIMLVMLVYMFVQKRYSIRRSRVFIGILLLNIVSTMLDIYASRMLNIIVSDKEYTNKQLVIANILSTLYFLILFWSIFLFAVYAILISCGFDYIHKKKGIAAYFYLPVVIASIILISNFFECTFIQYGFSDGFVLVKTNLPGFSIITLCGSIYLIQSVLIMYKFKTVFEKKQLVAFTFVFPIVFIGFFLEIIYPKYLVLSFMLALFIIIMQTVFESSEDLIDTKTNFLNIEEFNNCIKKIFYSKDNNKIVVLVRIINYKDLMTAYSDNSINNFLLEIANYIKKYRINYKIKDEVYSLNNGYYASVFKRKNIKEFKLEYFYDDEIISENNIDFLPKFEFCYLEPYNDFKNSNEVLRFVKNFREMLKVDKDYVKYNDIKDDNLFVIQNELNEILDTALLENEFDVYYQPIYSIKDKRFKSAEALVRLISKKYGMISPADFIPYAENLGRISEIDSYVMENVFKFVSSEDFEKLGLEYIEINLSMAECAKSTIVDRIKQLKEKYNIDPKRINFEITESYDPVEQEIIYCNLYKLYEMGFELSLDDYGTGYSNINRFTNIPISVLKIDKSLVDDFKDENIKKILRFAFDIVHSLKKSTVIEGVETKEQLDEFIKYGADYIQGFYFSRPLNLEDFTKFIKNNN